MAASLALFNGHNTILNHMVYFGVNRCQPAWYVTGPASNILIENIVTYAGAGVVLALATAGRRESPSSIRPSVLRCTASEASHIPVARCGASPGRSSGAIVGR